MVPNWGKIPAELLKALGAKGKNELYDICNEIYISGEWPDDLLDSVIITIEKKCEDQDCVYFRTISLVSHATAESYLGKGQFGFR